MHIEPSVLNCELIDSSCPSFPQIVLIFYAIIRLISGPQITTSSHRHSDAPVAVLPIVWLAFRAMITIALLQYTGPAFNDLDEWRGLEFGELFLLGREELPIFSKFPWICFAHPVMQFYCTREYEWLQLINIAVVIFQEADEFWWQFRGIIIMLGAKQTT